MLHTLGCVPIATYNICGLEISSGFLLQFLGIWFQIVIIFINIESVIKYHSRCIMGIFRSMKIFVQPYNVALGITC